MDGTDQNTRRSEANDFSRQAEQESTGLVRELIDFMRYNKKWWLAPIITILLIFGLLVFFSGAAAPFIYTLF